MNQLSSPPTPQDPISLPPTILQISWWRSQGAVIGNEFLCVLYQSATEFLSVSVINLNYEPQTCYNKHRVTSCGIVSHADCYSPLGNESVHPSHVSIQFFLV